MKTRTVVLIDSDGEWREMVVTQPVVRVAIAPPTAIAVAHDEWNQSSVWYEVVEYRSPNLVDSRGYDVLTPDGRDVPLDRYPYQVFRVCETAWATVWVSDLERDYINGLSLWDMARQCFKSLHDGPAEWRQVGDPVIDYRDESTRATKYRVYGQALIPVKAVEAVA